MLLKKDWLVQRVLEERRMEKLKVCGSYAWNVFENAQRRRMRNKKGNPPPEKLLY